MNGTRARCLVAVVTVVAIVAGCSSRGATSPAPDPATPSPPATSAPTVEPTTATPSPSPTPAPTPEPTPAALAKPGGVRFDVSDEGTCPSDAQLPYGPGEGVATCSIDERVVTVSWKAPRTEGVEIRVYGVTRCFGTDANGVVIDGTCLREHTQLPASALVLLASAPSSDGGATVSLLPSARGLADTQRGEKVYSVVLGAFDDAGEQSVMAIAATQDYCEATKDPCDSRHGVTMTGRLEDRGAGRLLIRVSMAGLMQGESVTLKASARYSGAWTCGACEGNTGGLCPWTYSEPTVGTARATVRAVADAEGTASAKLRLAVSSSHTPTCPADLPTDWSIVAAWTRIRVTEPAHLLRLTPDPVKPMVVY